MDIRFIPSEENEKMNKNVINKFQSECIVSMVKTRGKFIKKD